jgi:hypothetical protein
LSIKWNFSQVEYKIVIHSQNGQWFGQMEHLIVSINRSSHFLGQDRQWLNKIGHPIEPLDRSFEFFGQDGQWFNQMRHPIVL